MDFNNIRQEVLKIITLTKSDVWAYEKEWRVVSRLRNKTIPYEILPFAPAEIASVYLGCRMDHNNKNEVISIMRLKYPTARIFQADKHERNFSLVFKELI
jgi:hypothetical protein